MSPNRIYFDINVIFIISIKVGINEWIRFVWIILEGIYSKWGKGKLWSLKHSIIQFFFLFNSVFIRTKNSNSLSRSKCLCTSMMKIWQGTHQAFDLWGWDKRRGVYTCMELEYYEFLSFLFFFFYYVSVCLHQVWVEANGIFVAVHGFMVAAFEDLVTPRHVGS